MKRQTNAEKTDATRRALLTAGRQLFAKIGYGATSTESIVVKAKVTREAGFFISRADDKKKARQEIGKTVKQLLNGLRTPG